MKIINSRLSFRTKAIIAGVATTLVFTVTVSAPASAASSFSDHLWKFVGGRATNIIDFNRGASKIYDNGNLNVSTDDYINLNAPKEVRIQKDLTVGNVLKIYRNGANAGGSKIYENGNLHVATDDYLLLDAPSAVKVSNVLDVGSSSSLFSGTTNRNCDEACVDLTPNSEGGKSAVFEFQGDTGLGATESSGIALNSDTINIWSPGDVGILRVYDEDDFCTDCTLGEVGDNTEGVIAALFEIDGAGGVHAVGDSHFYGDLMVDGALFADYNIDNNIDGVTGDFKVGYDTGGNLLVYGDTTTDNLGVLGDISLCKGSSNCMVELQNNAHTRFNYNNGESDLNWQQYVKDDYEFTLYNSNSDSNVLRISEDGDMTVAGNLNVQKDATMAGNVEVANYSYFNNGAEFGGTVDVYGDLNVWDGYSLYVDGTATINNLIVNNSTAWGGTVTYSGTATYNGGATFNGGQTYNGGATYVGTATFNNTTTFNGTVVGANGSVINFSAATSLRVPVTSGGIIDGVTGCSTSGIVTFSTNDNHFYGCDGTNWQIFDN